MPKGKARVFGQDLMRGEHVVGKRKRKATAIPGGGGGGCWMDMARTQAERQTAIPAGLNWGAIENFDGAGRTITGTSIFDPVLAELVYRWFCPPGGAILDPFAGGSVRGIVAHKLGRRYTGIDLSARQLAANEAQADGILAEHEGRPSWITGDSRSMGDLLPESAAFDFVFSCPPWAALAHGRGFRGGWGALLQ
jgi:hypothetical protein